MDTVLWIVQGVLLVAFLGAGARKMFQPREVLVDGGMAFVEDFNDTVIKQIGTIEVLGAIGVILPMLVNILPVLTPLAAIGLMLVMVGAAYTHLRRNEFPMIGVNALLLALALLVAYGRLVAEPVI